MKPEILLKAYVLYESEDAFRELVAGSLDEVYSRALRIIDGPPHLVEETVLKVYWELARKARWLGNEVVLEAWLRKHTCKWTVIVLRQEGRSVNRAVLIREKQGTPHADSRLPAPPGLATRVCQGILLNAASRKGLGVFRLPVWRFSWLRPRYVGAVAVGVLALLLCTVPLHKRHAIVMSPGTLMTPAAFAQLASPEEVGLEPVHAAGTNLEIHPSRP